MPNNLFFEESLEQSRIKAQIVSKYFWAWAKIIISTSKKSGNRRIAYIDLFAGPGRYKDQTKSTPILVLEQAIGDPDMCSMLVTMFNDANSENTQALEREINALPNIDRLRYKPIVYNNEVGDHIVKMFEEVSHVPTLFFVDPWGYKGLSLRLINSVLKDWGCDCLFFFNYNRISMGLANEKVETHMNALFGEERAAKLRVRLDRLHGEERELAIVNEIAQALRDMDGKYVLPFRFRNDRGSRTSHHLIFVSKHFRGYEVMKGIMANQSSGENEGVSTFEYNPASVLQPMLYLFRPRPISDLKQSLLQDFAGKTLTMKQIYELHSVDTPYVAANYKKALKQLEAEERIITNPPANERRKNTFADHVTATFPLLP